MGRHCNEQTAEFAVILKMNSMFADLDADGLARIAGLCRIRHLAAGEILFRKGDAGDALFGVRRGQLRIETGPADGSRLDPAFRGPQRTPIREGRRARRLWPHRGCDRDASRPNCSCCGGRIFWPLEREPKVAIKIIMLLCQRIRWQSERMEESMLQPLPVRLARRLCALGADFGSEVHISQEQLGVFVGAARESVNRQLQLWRKDGILDLQRAGYCCRTWASWPRWRKTSSGRGGGDGGLRTALPSWFQCWGTRLIGGPFPLCRDSHPL